MGTLPRRSCARKHHFGLAFSPTRVALTFGPDVKFWLGCAKAFKLCPMAGDRGKFLSTRVSRTEAGTQTAPNKVVPPSRFPSIGFPGILVAVFVGSFVAAHIACDLTVLVLYGGHAFFREGLRVADWKHSILSNGAHLRWWGTLMIGPPVVPLTALMVFAAEFVKGRVNAFLAARSKWLTAGGRLVAAAALLGFSFWLYSPPQSFPLLHPIPLSTLIGGAVLLWKATVHPFGRSFSAP